MMRLGVKATIVGRNGERLKAAAKELSDATGQECLPVAADVRKPETLVEAVKQTVEKFGRIDFVICGAAGNYLAPIEKVSNNAFRTVIEIDTIGTYHTIKATLPYVRETQGTYLHISATLHYRGTSYQAHVSAAKAAVDALSRVLAVEEGPRGVRSNVIAPGGIEDTEGWTRLTPGDSSMSNLVASQVPLGRAGRTQDIANSAIFLFSPAANYITGQILVVDGGWEHLRSQSIPYPLAVLDPEAVVSMYRGKL